jgi:hypothetical protein
MQFALLASLSSFTIRVMCLKEACKLAVSTIISCNQNSKSTYRLPILLSREMRKHYLY